MAEEGIREKGRRWVRWAKVVLVFVLILYVVLLAVQNSQPVKMSIPFLFRKESSLALLVFVAFGLGLIAGGVGAALFLRRHRH